MWTICCNWQLVTKCITKAPDSHSQPSSVLLLAPANENSIDDCPVETPPVPLLIEQVHDAAELAPFASTSCQNNQAM